ncbi:MAG: D-inositol-3-phosphate glycosyltransferase, partial [Actinobacteria bacterium]|nr:D-inositol-3-phosphate glycosyltransferase [Actinomycetota bacterium]
TLVDGHDPRDHADAVLEFLRDHDLRACTSAAGIRNAAGASWERTVDGLLDVYREVGSEVVERGAAGA